MMLYLTGAASSLANSNEAPQTDVAKSLGGYISSSVVPNGSINALFDMISLITLKNKNKETIALGLINKFEENVRNVEIKLVTRPDYIGKFKIAATKVGSDYMMEHIDNRYSEPIQAEFNDVDFYRASVEVEIVKPAIAGEVISIQPLDINIIVDESGIEGTMNSIIKALEGDFLYGARKLSNNRFELFSKDDNTVSEPIECLAICSEEAELKFDGYYYNKKDNTALISEQLNPGEAIGLWLQREIVSKNFSDEELVKMSDDGIKFEEEEKVDLLITYDLQQ